MSPRSYDSSQHGKSPSPFIPFTFVAIGLGNLLMTLLWMLLGDPVPLALLHAFAVGVFLTIALGLLYQFIPVVGLGTLRFPRVAYVHALCALVGSALLVYGFQHAAYAWVAFGGALHGIGLLLQLVVLLATVRFRLPPAAAASALSSLGWLLGAIVLGVLMAERFVHGVAPGSLVYVHALVALGGFFGTLIVGITLRLLRMFERVDRESAIARTDIAAHAGIALALAGGLARWALPLALAPFVRSLLVIARGRNPAYQRETGWYTLCSTVGAGAAAVLFGMGRFESAIAIALWFFVGTAVVGYLQRIVPFIWWIRRARSEGARNIPSLGEMNDTRLGVAILVAWLVAGAPLLADATRIAAALALVALGLLLAQLHRPFTLPAKAQ